VVEPSPPALALLLVLTLAPALSAQEPTAAEPGKTAGRVSGAEAANRVVQMIEAGRLDDAERILRHNLEAGRRGPAVRYLLGVTLLRRFHFAEAEEQLRAAVAARPDRHRWLHDLAVSLLEQGRCAAALEVLDRAIALEPLPRYHYNKAMCALNVGDFELAERELGAVLAQLPQNPGALFHLGVLAADRGDAAGARGLFRAAVALQPDHLEAWFRLGLAELAAGDPGAAVAAFRKVLQEVPEHAGATYNLGRALITAGEVEKGREKLLDFRELSRRQERIENHLQYVHLDPTDADARLAAGRLLLAAGRDQEAQEQLEAARRLEPERAEVHLLLAGLYERQGKGQEALLARRYAALLKEREGSP
jgi:tetratricopeptide (TPR) repeat protein